jgi:cell division FtsZ-interacting protein ZapD
MNEEERWKHIVSLDEDLLKGGVILSEWCSFIVRESDLAFVHGANLASILTAVSGIETYLRSEYSAKARSSLLELIDGSPVADDLRSDLHKLRKYRNKWVHVNDPWEDQKLIDASEESEKELEEMALLAAKALRRTIYGNPWV